MGLLVGVRVKTTERIVMDETGTCVVQSVRRARAAIRPQIAVECPWNVLGAEPGRCFDRFVDCPTTA